jgi:hypothetical protein
MKILRETIRSILLENTLPVDAFQDTLGALVDSSSFDGYANIFYLQQGECLAILEIHIDESESGDRAWVNSLHTTDVRGKPSAACYRKGHAAQMMSRLIQAADQHGITLDLIAAPPPQMVRQDPNLPNADQLAKFYARFGFVETKRNIKQVYMTRTP